MHTTISIMLCLFDCIESHVIEDPCFFFLLPSLVLYAFQASQTKLGPISCPNSCTETSLFMSYPTPLIIKLNRCPKFYLLQ